jgi:hypothetical protein
MVNRQRRWRPQRKWVFITNVSYSYPGGDTLLNILGRREIDIRPSVSGSFDFKVHERGNLGTKTLFDGDTPWS